MKQSLFLFLICVITTPLFSQIQFEKGYFITNDDQLITCEIRNSDSERNPVSFTYRLSDSGNIYQARIDSVKEYCIDGFSKFVRKTVYIDRSPMEVDKLSLGPEPEWNREQLFLKVLVEGEKTLYSYNETNFRRFFYSNGDSVKQLVYKEYALNGSRVGYTVTKNTFRAQLVSDVHFTNSEKIARNIGYYKNDLVRYFRKYHEIKGDTAVYFTEKNGRDYFNLSISSGFNAISADIRNNLSDSRDTEFDRQFLPRIALEAEFVLPFNKNKWSIILESSFSYYKDSKDIPGYSNEILLKTVDLSVILKHHIFLNNYLKFYTEASVNSFLNKDFNSAIYFNERKTLTELKNIVNLGFGAGISYKRVNLGFRYFTPQEILGKYNFWTSKVNKYSVVLGFKIID